MNLHRPHSFWILVLITALLATPLTSPLSQPTRAAAADATFVDPTALVAFQHNVWLGKRVYIGPFANLISNPFGAARSISVGNESNVQDNATLDATRAPVTLGEQAIVAHGGTVKGAVGAQGFRLRSFPAEIGVRGNCPGRSNTCPSFVSFNALVEGATIQKDAMVGALARVGPGVLIPSGYKVLPGKNIATQADVTIDGGKIAFVTEADREFMRGVIEVNLCFAQQYSELARANINNVRGINVDPGNCSFNPKRELPTLGANHQATREPNFRNRIIGDVRLANSFNQLNRVMGIRDSLRADEGEAFEVGSIEDMADGVVFHALEHTHLHLGEAGRYGLRSVIHGGPTDFIGFQDTTITGDHFSLGEGAVFFRSRIGKNSRVGARSLVQQSDLPDNTVIRSRKIIIDNQDMGNVEW